MAYKKSSRVIDMNYIYEIENILITETDGETLIRYWWSITEIMTWKSNEIMAYDDKKSFERTQRWIIENHPELIM